MHEREWDWPWQSNDFQVTCISHLVAYVLSVQAPPATCLRNLPANLPPNQLHMSSPRTLIQPHNVSPQTSKWKPLKLYGMIRPTNARKHPELARVFAGISHWILLRFSRRFFESLAEVVAQGFAMLEKTTRSDQYQPRAIVPQQTEGGTTALHWCPLSVQVWVYCFCTVGPNRMTSWNLKFSTGVCDVPNKHSNEVYGRGVRNCERHVAQGTSMATSCAHACRAAQNLSCLDISTPGFRSATVRMWIIPTRKDDLWKKLVLQVSQVQNP